MVYSSLSYMHVPSQTFAAERLSPVDSLLPELCQIPSPVAYTGSPAVSDTSVAPSPLSSPNEDGLLTPANSFMIFRSDLSKKLKRRGVKYDSRGATTLSELAGKQWRAMSPSEKAPWQKRSLERQRKFEEMYPSHEAQQRAKKALKVAKRSRKLTRATSTPSASSSTSATSNLSSSIELPMIPLMAQISTSQSPLARAWSSNFVPSYADGNNSLPTAMESLPDDTWYTTTSGEMPLDATLFTQQPAWFSPSTYIPPSFNETLSADLWDVPLSLGLSDHSEFGQTAPFTHETFNYSNNMSSPNLPFSILSGCESYTFSSHSCTGAVPSNPSPYQLPVSTYSSLAGWQS